MQLQRTLEVLAALGLFAILLTVVVQVLLSSLFNSSLTGANELITKLFVYVTAIGAAVAVGRGEHIAISVVTDRMSGGQQRIVERLNVVLVGLLNLTVLLYSFHWIAVTGHFLMPTTQLPRAIAQIAIPIGAGVSLLFCVLRFFSPPQDAERESEV